MKYLFLITLFIIGCSQQPQVGDIYEHKLEKYRVEVEGIGKCSEVYRNQEYRNEKIIERKKENGYSRKEIFTGVGIRAKDLYPLYKDSTNTCIGYDREIIHPVYKEKSTNYYIVPEQSFNSDFRLID
jgi:hypothetical protein